MMTTEEEIFVQEETFILLFNKTRIVYISNFRYQYSSYLYLIICFTFEILNIGHKIIKQWKNNFDWLLGGLHQITKTFFKM